MKIEATVVVRAADIPRRRDLEAEIARALYDMLCVLDPHVEVEVELVFEGEDE